RSSADGGGRLRADDRGDRGGVVGEAGAVLARVGSLAAIPAQLHLQGQELAEEGGPLRRGGPRPEGLDPWLAAALPFRFETPTRRVDAIGLRRRQPPEVIRSALVHPGPPSTD